MNHRKLSDVKDKDEKHWMIESAARTLQEMGRISKDPELLTAAKKEVDKQISESEAAKKLVSRINEKSPTLQKQKT